MCFLHLMHMCIRAHMESFTQPPSVCVMAVLKAALQFGSVFAGEEQLGEWLHDVEQCFYYLSLDIHSAWQHDDSSCIHNCFTSRVGLYAERQKHADVCKYYFRLPLIEPLK